MSLLFGVARIFNFAHGEFYMWGAYAALILVGTPGNPGLLGYGGLNYFLALLLAMVAMGALGVLAERVLFRPIRGQIIAAMVMSFGIALAGGGGTLLVFGERSYGVKPPIAGTVGLLGSSIAPGRLLVIVAALGIMALLYLFIRSTRTGRSIQATAQDLEVATIMGVDINRVSALTFGISTALAGAAGVLMAPVFAVSPSLASDIILKLLVVMVLGGLGTIQGAAAGGIVLGFIEAFSTYFIGGLGYIPGFIALMLILLVRPWGLVGVKER